LILVTLISGVSMRGGFRFGAGRPKGEDSVVVRVPVGCLHAVKSLIESYKSTASSADTVEDRMIMAYIDIPSSYPPSTAPSVPDLDPSPFLDLLHSYAVHPSNLSHALADMLYRYETVLDEFPQLQNDDGFFPAYSKAGLKVWINIVHLRNFATEYLRSK
jgi:hypothetical protein